MSHRTEEIPLVMSTITNKKTFLQDLIWNKYFLCTTCIVVFKWCLNLQPHSSVTRRERVKFISLVVLFRRLSKHYFCFNISQKSEINIFLVTLSSLSSRKALFWFHLFAADNTSMCDCRFEYSKHMYIVPLVTDNGHMTVFVIKVPSFVVELFRTCLVFFYTGSVTTNSMS